MQCMTSYGSPSVKANYVATCSLKHIRFILLTKKGRCNIDRVKNIKCKHNNVWHIDECEGDSNYDIFECKDCGEYLIVEKLYHDWDNASVIPKHHYEIYDLKIKEEIDG